MLVFLYQLLLTGTYQTPYLILKVLHTPFSLWLINKQATETEVATVH